MLERSDGSPARRQKVPSSRPQAFPTDVTPLRAATAQLLCATGVAATLGPVNGDEHTHHSVPRPLAWAPLLVGPMAAAAQIQHARKPREQTANAVRLLDGAVIALGGALFLADLIGSRRFGGRGVGALAFASVGLLGVLLERHEEDVNRAERQLSRRADVVERLVPKRRPKLDRIVVHV